MSMADWVAAVETYSQTLAFEKANPGVRSNACLEYPLLIANFRRRDKYDEVFQLVEIGESYFAAHTHSRYAALALIHDDLGHHEEGRRKKL